MSGTKTIWSSTRSARTRGQPVPQRLVSVVLAICLLISTFTSAYATSPPTTTSQAHREAYQYEYFTDMMRYLADYYEISDITLGDGSSIVQVAQHELEQAENGVAECANGNKYKDAAGISRTDPWCCAFVYWCADQCGYIGECFGPYTASCMSSWAWFERQGLTKQASYTPKPGDLIYFHGVGGSAQYNSEIHHIGIVVSCDGSTVTTIEGNTSHTIHERRYSLSNSYIVGYATPEYPATNGTSYLNANTPQEYIWLYGLSQGYSPVAVAGIMGNIYQECSSGTKQSEQAVHTAIMSGNETWNYQTKHTYSNGACDYGIVQWTDAPGADSYTRFLRYCNQHSLEPSDIGAQAQCLFYELSPDGWRHRAGELLQAVTTPEEAAVIFQEYYEGISEATGIGRPMTAHRKWAARAYYDKFKDLTYGNGSSGNSSIAEAAVSLAYKTSSEAKNDWGTPLFQVLKLIQAGRNADGSRTSVAAQMSCDTGASAIIHWSGADDLFPCWCGHHFTYFSSQRGREKWVEIKDWTLSDLQPGDVGVWNSEGHILIYVGYEAASKRWPGISAATERKDYTVESSYHTPASPRLIYSSFSSGKVNGMSVRFFRNIKSESNSDYKDMLSTQVVSSLINCYDSGLWPGDGGHGIGSRPQDTLDRVKEVLRICNVNATITKRDCTNTSGYYYTVY